MHNDQNKFNLMKSSKITFSLAAIDTVQFATIGNAPAITDNIEETITLSFTILEASRIIDCNFGYTLSKSKAAFITIQVVCSFQLAQKDFNKLLHAAVLKIPVDAAQQITMHTIGTTRGILHSKTENTPFNDFPVGLIDIQDIVNEDIPVELSTE